MEFRSQAVQDEHSCHAYVMLTHLVTWLGLFTLIVDTEHTCLRRNAYDSDERGNSRHLRQRNIGDDVFYAKSALGQPERLSRICELLILWIVVAPDSV